MAYITSVVDDMLIASPSNSQTLNNINHILSVHKGTHSGVVSMYCGMAVTWKPAKKAVLLSQSMYMKGVLHRFQPLQTDWFLSKVPMSATARLTTNGIASQDPPPPWTASSARTGRSLAVKLYCLLHQARHRIHSESTVPIQQCAHPGTLGHSNQMSVLLKTHTDMGH